MAQISAAECIDLKSNPGFYLEKNAARAWDRAVKEYGKSVLLTGAWRSLQTQEQLFDGEKYPATGRYLPGRTSPFGDYRRYKGRTWGRVRGAAAAVPGTSNHGSGRAVDVKTSRSKGDPAYPKAVVFTAFNDPDRLAFLKVANKHGWYDDEGRSVGELWHLTYYPDRDKHKGETGQVIYFQKGTKKADQVKVLQRFLRKFGYTGRIDGVYGEGTEAAVKVWQKKAGMKPAGKIGNESLKRLRELGVF